MWLIYTNDIYGDQKFQLSAVYLAYVSLMSAVCQPHISRMSAVWCISRLSTVYFCHISAVCPPYDVSAVCQPYISAICQLYVLLMSAIPDLRICRLNNYEFFNGHYITVGLRALTLWLFLCTKILALLSMEEFSWHYLDMTGIYVIPLRCIEISWWPRKSVKCTRWAELNQKSAYHVMTWLGWLFLTVATSTLM